MKVSNMLFEIEETIFLDKNDRFIYGSFEINTRLHLTRCNIAKVFFPTVHTYVKKIPNVFPR